MKENNLIDLLETRFKELFKKERLLGIKLDGFSHTVAFDDGNKESEVEIMTYTSYAPELKQDKRVALLFNGIGHMSYQGNPFIHYWFSPEQR